MEKDEKKKAAAAVVAGAAAAGDDGLERKGNEENENTSLLASFTSTSSSSSPAEVAEAPFHESEPWLKLQGSLLESLAKERDGDDSITMQQRRPRNEPWVLTYGGRRVVNLVDVTRNYVCVKFDRPPFWYREYGFQLLECGCRYRGSRELGDSWS